MVAALLAKTPPDASWAAATGTSLPKRCPTIATKLGLFQRRALARGAGEINVGRQPSIQSVHEKWERPRGIVGRWFLGGCGEVIPIEFLKPHLRADFGEEVIGKSGKRLPVPVSSAALALLSHLRCRIRKAPPAVCER